MVLNLLGLTVSLKKYGRSAELPAGPATHSMCNWYIENILFVKKWTQ